MLPSHSRYGYEPITRPAGYSWPEGRGLAVYVALNLEHYAFGEGLKEELAPGGPEPDVLNYAWRDYGNRVGAWRLLDLAGDLGLPLTVLVNSAVYEHGPGLIEAFRAAGHEIAAHGRTNSERQGDRSEPDERALIEEATAIIARHEGRRPRGWLGPWISESRVTPDLLKEAGYLYCLDWCCDDRPIALSTRAGKLLALPYPQEANDSNAIVARRMGADAFADMIVDQFDEMLIQAEGGPLVFSVALHPYITGQPFRLRQLRRAFKHIVSQRERIWLTRAEEIAARAAPALVG
jgi:allantoinase